ncbi:uncharacterized protein LOC135847910 isoform X2 [Planococcus citri]|uniref:uncharacterized protein LOC135847910 isoform X2 n=1 Tax=Planococcus citri TaxID=170843 RepID=UPI0031F8F648
MSRISKENFGCFECSLRTDTLATFIISLVVSELPDYLVSHGYRKYPEYYQRLYDSIPEVVFIAWSSSVIGALCGAIKNQPLLLIPYVVVKLLDMVFSIIQTFAVESHQSVVAVDIRPFIVADSYIVWSFSIVGLYGVMREKPVLQIIYLVVESLNWVSLSSNSMSC